MKKGLMALLTAAALVLSIVPFTKNTYAIGVTGCGISNPGSVKEGEKASVSYTVSTNDSMTASILVSVSGGGTLASVSASVGSVNGNRVVLSGVDGVTSISGTITFNVTSASPVVVSISGDVSSINDFSSANISASQTINVYSKAQQQADAAAAEESRRQQEAYNASVAASKAVEDSIAASIYAESSKAQQAIDDSIAAEQASIQESEAAVEASVNESIAESVSVEESSIQESLSIEESIAESELEVAESISESESEVERTKAVKIGFDYYVPFKTGRGKFLFAAEDTALGVPEGYEKTDLMVNLQYVWAYRTEDMEAHAYLVYGQYENDAEPKYYFYDETNGTFFPYEKLYAEEEDLPVPTTTEETVNENPQTEKKGIGTGIIVLLCIVSMLLGAGLAVLAMMYMKNHPISAFSGVKSVTDDEEDFVQDAEGDEIDETGEEYEFENNGVGLEEEDIVIPVGETETAGAVEAEIETSSVEAAQIESAAEAVPVENVTETVENVASQTAELEEEIEVLEKL